MIDLYTTGTPNGQKASIMLEEVALPYRVNVVRLSEGENKRPDFLSVNPNGKIPAIVDSDGPDGVPFRVFESGAILIYLAEKVSSPLLPRDPAGRSITLQWLMWQMSAVGPSFGQAAFFGKFAKTKIPDAIHRFTTEAHRLLAVLDLQLTRNEYIAGATYTIADIATWPWISGAEFIGLDLGAYSNVRRWVTQISERSAVQRGKVIGQVG